MANAKKPKNQKTKKPKTKVRLWLTSQAARLLGRWMWRGVLSTMSRLGMGKRAKACKGVPCGYAGGLGPQNVASELPGIAAQALSDGCWIDMESGVRTDGLFDLGKCALVLAASEP